MTVSEPLAENPSWRECDDVQRPGSHEDLTQEAPRPRAGDGAEDLEASIDDYVARLLQRVSGPSVDATRSPRVTPPAADHAPAPSAPLVTVSLSPQPPADRGRPAIATSSAQPSRGRASGAVATADRTPAPARERHRFSEDLSAMRELANQSAHAAIKTFEKRSSFEQALVNAAYLLMVLPCFAILWLGKGPVNPTLASWAVGLGCLVLIVAGTRATQLFLRSRA